MSDRLSPLEARLLPKLRSVQETHGRVLAAELGVDAGATARALNRMEGRGLVSSRWVGRTRLYRLGPDRTLIGEARALLEQVPDVHPVAVLPFGSRATGGGGPDSDLDLVVIVPDAEVTANTWQALRRALWDINVPIDLLVYSLSDARRWGRVPSTPVQAALELLAESEREALGL